MRWTIAVPIILSLLSACNDVPTAAPSADIRDAELGRPAVLARVVVNTINPFGTLTDNGYHLELTGPITCTAGQSAEVRVTVTQRTTAAVAEGRRRVACTGISQEWHVQLQKTGKESFEAGAAIAIGFARTFDNGQATDAHQWLVAVTLTD